MKQNICSICEGGVIERRKSRAIKKIDKYIIYEMFIENWMKNEIYRLSKDEYSVIGITEE